MGDPGETLAASVADQREEDRRTPEPSPLEALVVPHHLYLILERIFRHPNCPCHPPDGETTR